MKINFAEVDTIMPILKKAKQDELVRFVSHDYEEMLESIREENKNILFDTARKYGIRYFYLGKGEICGCENITQKDSPWPAMWAIAKEVGFPPSCGNSDQYQTNEFSGIYFPENSYGGWDLLENRKLSDEETKAKKFSRVVSVR